jgi:phosphoenolpyruvate synthase/pyruvate phosphate dikinase
MSDRPRAAPRFERKFFGAAEAFTCIGSGSAGGKASGLLQIKDVLAARLPPEACAPYTVEIPTLTVIATDAFDRFVRENGLGDVVGSDAPDDRIAHAFQHATLPSDLVGDLRALIEHVHTPLAVRSSSLLEDALLHPFAGVYGTKMIPNNQPDVDTRFHKLVEAVKFVYAST